MKKLIRIAYYCFAVPVRFVFFLIAVPMWASISEGQFNWEKKVAEEWSNIWR